MDESILEVLQDIRSEAKLTNERLASFETMTNIRFESLDGRVERVDLGLQAVEGRFDFLEKRVSTGFENVVDALKQHTDRMDGLLSRQIMTEVRVETHVMSLGNLMRDVRDLLVTKFEDHETVRNHEERIRALEDRVADKDEDT